MAHSHKLKPRTFRTLCLFFLKCEYYLALVLLGLHGIMYVKHFVPVLGNRMSSVCAGELMPAQIPYLQVQKLSLKRRTDFLTLYF